MIVDFSIYYIKYDFIYFFLRNLIKIRIDVRFIYLLVIYFGDLNLVGEFC